MKKALAVILALVMVLAFTVPTMASEKLPAASEGFAFHCNDIEGGGNGRTYIVGKDKDFGKFDKKLNIGLIQLKLLDTDPTQKTWLIDGYNYTDSFSGEWVCTTCGRTDWVSFSNKSGIPDGKNIQLQHPGPSRRLITIQVIYRVEIPACEFTCVNAGATCGFVCDCGGACAKEAAYPGHTPCTWLCGVGHTCPFDADLTCPTVCDCAKSYSEVIVNIPVCIVIADGILFEHNAPDTWEGGALVSGSPISELLFSSATFYVDYAGVGDCACECDPVSCDAACRLCDYIPPPTHEHIAVCENCKSGVGSNHDNHITQNPENNTNYFCLICGIKLGSWNGNQGWRDADNNPGPELTCNCPRCT